MTPENVNLASHYLSQLGKIEQARDKSTPIVSVDRICFYHKDIGLFVQKMLADYEEFLKQELQKLGVTI